MSKRGGFGEGRWSCAAGKCFVCSSKSWYTRSIDAKQKRMRKSLFLSWAGAISLVGMFVAFGVSAQGWNPLNYAGYGLPFNSVWGIIETLMMWLLSLIAMIAVIAFVISGFQFLTSAGNEKMVETAKRNMTWSIVGVIVALLGLIVINAVDWLLQGYDRF